MDDPTSTNRRIRQRLRRAAGQLTEDSSVRDHLTDDLAQPLIDWALAQVEQTAVRTAYLPDETAAPLLEEKVTAVRAIMRLVNQLMRPITEGTAEPEGEEVMEEELTRLFKNLVWLTGQPTDLAHLRQAEKFRQIRRQPNPDPAVAFQPLMTLLEIESKPIAEEEE
jgi:hypothetical protein